MRRAWNHTLSQAHFRRRRRWGVLFFWRLLLLTLAVRFPVPYFLFRGQFKISRTPQVSPLNTPVARTFRSLLRREHAYCHTGPKPKSARGGASLSGVYVRPCPCLALLAVAISLRKTECGMRWLLPSCATACGLLCAPCLLACCALCHTQRLCACSLASALPRWRRP